MRMNPMHMKQLAGSRTGQLRHFHLGAEVALQAGKEDLALGRLEAVHHGRDGPDGVRHGELDEVRIKKVGIAKAGRIMAGCCA
jgi:hypothetical protein